MTTLQKVSLVGLIILLVIAITITGFLIYVLFRNRKLKQYAEKLKTSFSEINKFNSNRSSTILRFRMLANNKSEYLRDLKKLKSLDDKMSENQDTLLYYKQQIEEYIKQYKLKLVEQEFETYESIMQSFLDAKNEFISISSTLNKHWQIIDRLATYSIENLKIIIEYLDSHKDKLQHSYQELKNEANRLLVQVNELEARKIADKIENVTLEINEHEKRISSFIKKVDHIVNLEAAIFDQLPIKLEEFSKMYPRDTKIKKLIEEVKNLQASFTETPYQKQLDKTRKIYYQYHLLTKEYENNLAFNEYLRANNVKIINYFDEQFLLLHKNIQELIPLKHVLNYDKSKLETLKFNFANVASNYDAIKLSLWKNRDIGFLTFRIFVDSFSELLNEINDVIQKRNNWINKMNYDKFYLHMCNFWYYNVLDKKDLIEDSSENESKFKDLIQLKLQVDKDIQLNKYIDYNNEHWIKWINLLQELYELTFTRFIYKQMAEKMLEQINNNRNTDNKELNEIVRLCNSHILAYKFQEAYELLIGCLIDRKGKWKYV